MAGERTLEEAGVPTAALRFISARWRLHGGCFVLRLSAAPLFARRKGASRSAQATLRDGVSHSSDFVFCPWQGLGFSFSSGFVPESFEWVDPASTLFQNSLHVSCTTKDCHDSDRINIGLINDQVRIERKEQHRP